MSRALAVDAARWFFRDLFDCGGGFFDIFIKLLFEISYFILKNDTNLFERTHFEGLF